LVLTSDVFEPHVTPLAFGALDKGWSFGGTKGTPFLAIKSTKQSSVNAIKLLKLLNEHEVGTFVTTRNATGDCQVLLESQADVKMYITSGSMLVEVKGKQELSTGCDITFELSGSEIKIHVGIEWTQVQLVMFIIYYVYYIIRNNFIFIFCLSIFSGIFLNLHNPRCLTLIDISVCDVNHVLCVSIFITIPGKY
jgi:hypothetical protein